MRINIGIKRDCRKLAIRYMTVKAEISALQAEEKVLKSQLIEIFKAMAHSLTGAPKTLRSYLTLRWKGEIKAVVYNETTAKGRVDWEAYAKALGGTVAGAEKYRKPATVQRKIDWANDVQLTEITGIAE